MVGELLLFLNIAIGVLGGLLTSLDGLHLLGLVVALAEDGTVEITCGENRGFGDPGVVGVVGAVLRRRGDGAGVADSSSVAEDLDDRVERARQALSVDKGLSILAARQTASRMTGDKISQKKQK